MKLLRLTLIASAASLMLGGAALAEDIKPSFAANLAVTSDYVFRGVSQSGTYDPAIQGGVDVGYGMFYAGAWSSTIKYGCNCAELDVYGGIKPAAGGFNFDLGVIGYLYPGAPNFSTVGYNTNYIEFKAAVSHPMGPATLGAAVFVSPDFSFTPGKNVGVYYEGNVSIPVHKNVTLSGAVGHQWVEGALPFPDYTTWNIGATWNFLPHLSLDARYVGTDQTAFFGDYGGSRGIVTLKVVYP
jgi:uncharacterized protein (TIGR02001 family)